MSNFVTFIFLLKQSQASQGFPISAARKRKDSHFALAPCTENVCFCSKTKQGFARIPNFSHPQEQGFPFRLGAVQGFPGGLLEIKILNKEHLQGSLPQNRSIVVRKATNPYRCMGGKGAKSSKTWESLRILAFM